MRILLKIVAAIALLTAVAYGFDDLYVRLRHEPYADVRIDRILAVSQKFNKIDYERTDPITEKCVYSLFPHAGHSPCWYLMRHTSRIVDIG
jgi:hypothetical protein